MSGTEMTGVGELDVVDDVPSESDDPLALSLLLLFNGLMDVHDAEVIGLPAG